MIRRHMVLHGRVQGVGLRFTARTAANMYGCTGWVRNDPEGTVTLEIQGSEDAIGRVIQAIERGLFIRIENMESRSIPPLENERGFHTEA